MRLAALFALLASAALGQSHIREQLQRGINAQTAGDLASAVRIYEDLLKEHPTTTQARINMAAALVGLNRFEEAIAAYKTALAQSPKRLDIQKDLALAYYTSGDLQDAAAEYEKLHAALPADTHSAVILAECELRLGRPQQAVAVIEPMAQAHPSDPDLGYVRGMALIRVGRPEEGAAFVERAAEKSRSADAYLLAGATQLNLGHFAAARNDLDRAVELNPDLPGVLYWAALAKDRAGDEDAAKDLLLRALRKAPDDFDANLHLAAILYREREYQAAKPYADEAARLHPESPMARYASALLKAALGNIAAATADLELIVQQSPNWIEPHVKLASLYFQQHRAEDGEREHALVSKLNADHSGTSSPFETQ